MDDGVRKSYNLTQKELASQVLLLCRGRCVFRHQVDIGTQRKLFNFNLPGGPFTVNTSSNGRYMVVGSRGGQFTVLIWQNMRMINYMCWRQHENFGKFFWFFCATATTRIRI